MRRLVCAFALLALTSPLAAMISSGKITGSTSVLRAPARLMPAWQAAALASMTD